MLYVLFFFFFFNDTATTEIYTLSLHDALPINQMLTGFQDEKRYIALNRPAPLPVFLVIRECTSGGVPFAKYLCMQKDFRTLPDTVLEHPAILRMHALASRIIGWHNDIVSLPKELSRRGDVINLVITL